MLLPYQEETKQARCLIAGLPAPLVLSNAGKLIQCLHGSYFLPYRNTMSTLDASGVVQQNTIDAVYVLHIDTNFKLILMVALSRPV